MLENCIQVDCNISKEKLTSFIQDALDKVHGQHFEAEALRITLYIEGLKKIKLRGQLKSLLVDVPLKFSFRKPAGLFSIEGEGSLLLHLELCLQIDQTIGLKIKTTLLGHEWIDRPKLALGTLNVPAESLSNYVIRYMKESLLKKMDVKVNESIHLKELIYNYINQFATNYLLLKNPNLYLNAELKNIYLGELTDNEDQIYCCVWLHIDSKISDQPIHFITEKSTLIHWKDDHTFSKYQNLELEMSYLGLSKWITQEINGIEIGGKQYDLESVHIRYTHLLEIMASVNEPFKAIISITGQPYFDKNEQTIYVDNISVDVNAASLIYKLSSPIIEQVITSRLSDALPFRFTKYLQLLSQDIPSIKLLDGEVELQPAISQVTIEQINFISQKVIGLILIRDPILKLSLL
ncbi:MAG: DUF4403 family protein [Saprospiraceae bacterium]